MKFDLQGNKETFQTFINPGVKIPEFISHLTNIKDSDLKNAQKFSEIKEQITSFIGDCDIIGHFISFDVEFLQANGINLKNNLYDTAELTRIFIPYLPSYSLEILSGLLDLQHQEKHRALQDSIAAQELFIKIIDKIETLPEDLFNEIKELSSRSSWHFAQILQTLKHNLVEPQTTMDKSVSFSNTKPAEPELQSQSTTSPILIEEQEALKIIKKEKKSFILEFPNISTEFVENLAQESAKDTLILCPHHLFHELPTNLSPKITKVGNIRDCISQNRLAEFKTKKSFKSPEITALIKTLIWLKKTENGLLTEKISFSQDEKTILSHISAEENTSLDEISEPFINNLIKAEKESTILIAPYSYVPKRKFKHLIIIDTGKFSDNLQYQNTTSITLKKILEPIENLLELTSSEQYTSQLTEQETPSIHTTTPPLSSIKSRLEILFGLLESVMEPNLNKEDPYPQFEISNLEIFSQNWLRAKELVQSLIAESQELKPIINTKTAPYIHHWKNVLKTLQSVIVEPNLENFCIFADLNRNRELLIRKIPTSIKSYFESLSTQAKQFIIIGESSDMGNDCKLTKTLLGLPENTHFHKIKPPKKILEKTSIFLIKDIAPHGNQSFPQIIDFKKQFLAKEKGRTIIILNSNAKLEQFHTVLATQLKKENLTLLATHGTGGLGKILEMYKKSPETTTIVLTPNKWESFNLN